MTLGIATALIIITILFVTGHWILALLTPVIFFIGWLIFFTEE